MVKAGEEITVKVLRVMRKSRRYRSG